MSKEELNQKMEEIAIELEQEAMPFEQWCYEVKSTHQIIRKHLEAYADECVQKERERINKDFLMNLKN